MAGARDEPVIVTVGNIVERAAGAAHDDGPDGQKHDQPRFGPPRGGERDPPPGGEQQQPGADRPIEAGKARVGREGYGKKTVDPIAPMDVAGICPPHCHGLI